MSCGPCGAQLGFLKAPMRFSLLVMHVPSRVAHGPRWEAVWKVRIEEWCLLGLLQYDMTSMDEVWQPHCFECVVCLELSAPRRGYFEAGSHLWLETCNKESPQQVACRFAREKRRYNSIRLRIENHCPAVPTAIWLVVEVRQCPLRSGAGEEAEEEKAEAEAEAAGGDGL
eukprot:s2176_g2.t1